MGSRPTWSWEAIRARRALNEGRVAVWERLLEDEELLARVVARRGAGEDAIDGALTERDLDALDAIGDEDLYLAALSAYVTALGGHVEVVAVFPDETVTVRRVDGPSPPAAPPAATP